MKKIITNIILPCLFISYFSVIVFVQPIGAQTWSRSPCDSANAVLIGVNDTLRTRLAISNYKLLLIDRYLKDVDRKPSNIKYLKGWVRRAMK